MGRKRVALTIALSTLASVASTYAAGGGNGVAAGGPPEAELRNCRSRAEGTRPIKMVVRRNDIRIGPLVLGNVRSTRAVGATDDAEWPYAVKTPVLLPARSRVVLAIAPEATALAALQHRNAFVSAVRFTACFERVPAYGYRGTVGPTTFFPFGIALRERTGCIPMELWIEGSSQPVRRVVPVGRRSC